MFRTHRAIMSPKKPIVMNLLNSQMGFAVHRAVLYGLFQVAIHDDFAVEGDFDAVAVCHDLRCSIRPVGLRNPRRAGMTPYTDPRAIFVQVAIDRMFTVEYLDLHADISGVAFMGVPDAAPLLAAGVN